MDEETHESAGTDEGTDESAGTAESAGTGGGTDEFGPAVEARLQAEFGCAESDAERVAEAMGRACEADEAPDLSPAFVVEKLTDAPREYSVPEKWNWLVERAGRYLGTSADLGEYRVEQR